MLQINTQAPLLHHNPSNQIQLSGGQWWTLKLAGNVFMNSHPQIGSNLLNRPIQLLSDLTLHPRFSVGKIGVKTTFQVILDIRLQVSTHHKDSRNWPTLALFT